VGHGQLDLCPAEALARFRQRVAEFAQVLAQGEPRTAPR
jgi:hypothetical protein